MTAFEPFDDWLHELAYLTVEQTLELPAWMQTIAFVNQLAVTHLNDGAGALFYNEPEKVHPVAAALMAIEEPELAVKVLRVHEMLQSMRGRGTQGAHEMVLKQPLAALVGELDEHIEQRWGGIHDKMRAAAERNGWQATPH